jgi:hypothetical protein
MTELMKKAARMYREDAEANGQIPDEPHDSSGERSHQGRRYVILRNKRGPLAAFRVVPGIHGADDLRPLKRWPKAIDVAA